MLNSRVFQSLGTATTNVAKSIAIHEELHKEPHIKECGYWIL